jgi:hypothetical protein
MRTASLLVFLTVAVVASAGARSANLVTNPDFDIDAFGWNESNANIHVSRDATRNQVGMAGSGAGFVSNSHPIAGATFPIYQCALLSGAAGGTTYGFGAWIFTPSGQPTTGNAKVEIVYWDADNCLGQILATQATPATSVFDVWNLYTATSLAPAGSASVEVRLTLQKDDAGSVYSVAFDGVRFGIDPTTPVGLQRFDVQ